MSTRFFVLLSALGMFGLVGAPTLATSNNVRDEAIVNFSNPVLVGTEWVMGRAVVVHDDDAKARGEACTFIYAKDQTGQQKLVRSYKCERVQQKAADSFRLMTRLDSNGHRVLSGVQFRGQAFSHEFVRDDAPHVHGSN